MTIDSVRSMMTASRLTASLELDPLRPLLISDNAGVQPKKRVRILGPAAPIRPSTSAPPIQRQNGPKMNNSPFHMKLPTIPFSPYIHQPSLVSIQLSKTARTPIEKAVKCNQVLAFLTVMTLRTPSSISMLKNSLVRLFPNNIATTMVSIITRIVDQKLNVALTSNSPSLKDMKPTASSISGTDSSESV